MTKKYQDREFDGFMDRNSKKVFSDLDFYKCQFISCSISTTLDPRRRSIIRNVRLIDCEQRGCRVDAAIVEDVLINSFKTNGLLQSWGAVFQHVKLIGKLGRLMTSPIVAPAVATALQQKAFDDANADYYSHVDWALDIQEALFEEADLRGIPANLIKRDQDTQFIILREKALEGHWKDIDLSGTHWKTSIEMFLAEGTSDEVFVAPKRHPRFRSLLDGLWKLRDAGIIK